MSTYLIKPVGERERATNGLIALLARHGFDSCRRWPLGRDRELILIDAPETSTIHHVRVADGAWAVAVGPFLHAGASGAPALEAYLARFDPAAPRWADTQGHFTLIVHRAGTTYLLCDGLGAHKVYHDPGFAVLSNSFLAALTLAERPRIDAFGAYVYAWTGACSAGGSFVEQVRAAPANTLVQLGARVRVHAHAAPTLVESGAPPVRDLRDLAAMNLEVLQAQTDAIARLAEGRVRLSFSGGFDSRLLLALLRRSGVTPELFVYGGETDVDVRVAQTVAQATRLTCRRIDKTARPAPEPERMTEVLERALVMFDGWRPDGLYDTGADADDRAARHAGGYVPVNGGLGEIYRNFFNLSRAHTRIDDVVSTVYYSFDPAWARPRFRVRDYHARMARDLSAQLGESGTIPTARAHMLYPLFRGRFWTARDAEINQRFGAMMFPFLEHAAIARSARTPAWGRLHGRMQAEMIRQADPELAGLPSAYGFTFADGPDLYNRLSNLKSLYRPMWFRRVSTRLKTRGIRPDVGVSRDAIAATIDLACPAMSELFHVDRITDSDTYNRVLTMEYLAGRFGLAAPAP
jgi:asparagine synthase (glutamine-hydrolysing)